MSLNELLQKFENGFELYETNPLFNRCIKNLLYGADVYKVLESVIHIQSATNNQLEQIIQNQDIKIIVVSEEKAKEFEIYKKLNP